MTISLLVDAHLPTFSKVGGINSRDGEGTRGRRQFTFVTFLQMFAVLVHGDASVFLLGAESVPPLVASYRPDGSI